jgi:hypothetical protein
VHGQQCEIGLGGLQLLPLCFALVAVVALAGVAASMAPASGQADGEAAPGPRHQNPRRRVA